VAIVRRPPNPELPTPVEICQVDIRNRAGVRDAFQAGDVVVNAIGAGTLRRNDVESSTTAAAVAAAQDVGVDRYLAMSAGLVAIDWPFFKYVLKPLIFRNILEEHLRVEEIVRASSLRWTIVRPPKLTNGAARGYVTSLEPLPRAFSTSRSDVAAFIADELDARAHLLHAVFVASVRG
jgi:uncharacterized protein YbjT (DUF2867 family)